MRLNEKGACPGVSCWARLSGSGHLIWSLKGVLPLVAVVVTLGLRLVSDLVRKRLGTSHFLFFSEKTRGFSTFWS